MWNFDILMLLNIDVVFSIIVSQVIYFYVYII